MPCVRPEMTHARGSGNRDQASGLRTPAMWTKWTMWTVFLVRPKRSKWTMWTVFLMRSKWTKWTMWTVIFQGSPTPLAGAI